MSANPVPLFASRRRLATSRRCLTVALAIAACAAAFAAAAADPLKLRIAYLGERDADAWRGASQGLAEANAQGRFLGLEYELLGADSEADARALDASAIVADVSAIRLLRLAETVAETPVFNVSAPDDALREACVPNLFHTIPSDAMADDAVQQWQRKRPESAAEAKAWHPAFRKYAAAQLNQRYQESFGQPMSDPAWAAWAAVKLLSDTAARLKQNNPGVLMSAIGSDLAFDGQKGIPMSFRDTGQLRQPLLLVESGKIVGEAPVRGIVDPTNLDSLGLSSCLK
ncbi:MAG: ABC transporter substrate-binding protein [Gammaproteobacteria bacterium]